ncbi:NAD(P)-binding protein [Tothia fuscella]|uniref:NAD(P)-binding protein n=1 Tax=Tothia fuscella TaxID=1048955 RepID=A0A9P4TYE6_9PEZI|nr:NAD(P)-binding protein [Tothia fuscella]
MTIGVALIGSGIFAKEEHLPAIEACKSFALKAVYSRALKSAKLLGGDLENVDLYSEDSKSYSELLERDDVQAVIIALPITAQPQYIRQALERGKHVLSEKPIAEDTKVARELLKWYNEYIVPKNKATWGVAENFRYLESFAYAAEKVQGMGKILGFRVRVQSMVQPGGKYFETPWRKTPAYQGGFLLDGGVHSIAATRVLLGPYSIPKRLTAFATQLQPHLPPLDTIDSVWQTTSGISGTFAISFGTTFKGSEYAIACEKGTVSVSRGGVVCTIDGKEEKKTFNSEGSGVKQEVKAWAEGLENGVIDAKQSPDEALEDVRVLEAMLRSGEQNGIPIDLEV